MAKLTKKQKRCVRREVELELQVKPPSSTIHCNKKKYITVLDFEVGRVFQYKIDILKEKVSDSDTYVRYLGDKGHNLTNCEWMVHEVAGIINNNDGSYGKL